jgi:CRP/FNR family cyclic AMP-dependent transcriptional regulator
MASDDKLELLKRVPLLSKLGRKEIEEVGRLADEVDVPAGHVLMREGQTGQEFFVIVQGSVGLDRGGQHFLSLGPGDWLGEMALLADAPRNATATAETDAQMIVLGHREFHSLMDQFPSVRTCVLESLAGRISRLDPKAT